jgi:hypothetical protein
MKSLRLTCPEDLIAAAPSLLGFHPHDSVVLIAAGRPSFQARVDLPPLSPAGPGDPDDDVDEVVALLQTPVARHGIAAVVLLYFCADHARALRVHQPLLRVLQEGGVRVPEALHVTPTQYASLLDPGPPHWHPYDVGGHPLLAEAVFEGRQIQPDRAALAAEVCGDREAARAIGVALARTRFAPALAEAAWAAATVAALVEEDTEPDEATAARLIGALAIPEVRDAHWVDHSGPAAAAHARVWTGLLRRCPDRSLPAVASLTAMLRFRSGDGARAWCALDRAPDAAGHSLGSLVTELLIRGISPAEVDECWAGHQAGDRPCA